MTSRLFPLVVGLGGGNLATGASGITVVVAAAVEFVGTEGNLVVETAGGGMGEEEVGDRE